MSQLESRSHPSSDQRSRDESVIQPASWKDFLQVHNLEKACFGKDAWPWFDLLAALTFPETVCFKAIVDEQVVGFIVGDRRRSQKTGWIATVGVHPDFRRRGIAKLLMAEAEGAMALPRMRLTLRASNQAALTLYRQLGYGVVDQWKKYYADGEDGLVMEKYL